MPVARIAHTPARQFVLESVRFEERRDGRVLWRGTGKRADGDLQVSDVTEVELHRVPQTPDETAFVLKSPRGHLAFDAGRASFDALRVTEPGGAILTASSAVYDEAPGALAAAGPIHVSTPTLVARASSATVWVKAGTVEVHGPVEGRMHGLRDGAGDQHAGRGAPGM